MIRNSKRSIAIYYEHPNWFVPLFAALDRRHVPYERVHADEHIYDVADGAPGYSLIFNRMSPSAHLRGRAHAIFHALQYLAHLKQLGIRVVNGYDAFVAETSKAFQLSLLDRLGLPYPRARVISHPDEALAAAEGLRFPVVVKPNVGGSGAGIRRFDSRDALRRTVRGRELDLGIDRTALVQEFIPAADDKIVRVEVVGGKYLYAISVETDGETFNLCPADLCPPAEQAGPGESSGAAAGGALPALPALPAFPAASYSPPQHVVEAVEGILAAAQIEVGGVEYLVDARDGQLYYYDINATSNFVADAPRVIGFDPFEPLVDYLEREAAAASDERGRPARALKSPDRPSILPA